MKHKILWMVVSFLLVAALVLASCAKEEVVGEQEEEEEEEVVGEQEEEEEVVVPEAGEPQYGGTFTLLTERKHLEPPSFDQADGSYTCSTYLGPVMESLVVMDFEKYGPRGTDEFPFVIKEYCPDKFLRGQLAESWEITYDPPGILFHMREGVMWQANPHIGFEPREYTAYDAAFWGNRYRASPMGNLWLSPNMEEGAFEALDRYTLQVTFTKFMPKWAFAFGYGFYSRHYPPEIVEAGASDWRNQVGTGAFIMTDYVKGAYAAYEPNPDWWDKKKIVNGKEYDAPFIDKLVYPIIIDESTQVAALQTGAVDAIFRVPMRYKDTLAATNPDLLIGTMPAGITNAIWWKATGVIGSNRVLRRAMMIGTDLRSIIKTVYVEADLQCWPYNASFDTSIYTPLEDLPPSARELYTYDPKKAAAMIVDAGYPDGIEITLDYNAINLPSIDIAAILKAMWAKIGVTVTLKPSPDAVARSMVQVSGDYEDALLSGYGNCGGLTHLDNMRALSWSPYHDDEYVNGVLDAAANEMDQAARYAILKPFGIYVIEDAYYLPFGDPYLLLYWWPWVKNYYGETETGHTNPAGIVSVLWIDQALKAEMGY